VLGLVLVLGPKAAAVPEPWDAIELPEQISFLKRPQGKRVPVPDGIRIAIEQARRKAWASLEPKRRGVTFHIPAPKGRSLFAHRFCQGAMCWFDVYLYDAATGHRSPTIGFDARC